MGKIEYSPIDVAVEFDECLSTVSMRTSRCANSPLFESAETISVRLFCAEHATRYRR